MTSLVETEHTQIEDVLPQLKGSYIQLIEIEDPVFLEKYPQESITPQKPAAPKQHPTTH